MVIAVRVWGHLVFLHSHPEWIVRVPLWYLLVLRGAPMSSSLVSKPQKIYFLVFEKMFDQIKTHLSFILVFFLMFQKCRKATICTSTSIFK